MAQTLEHNKAVTTVTAVALPTFDDDVANIQKLDDEPNDVGGLTAAQLKAEFDKAGETIADYINETLIPAVLAQDSTEEARQLAEGERVANEQERVSNENARVSAEATRGANEAARGTAESTRNANEENRVAAEQARADENNGIVAQATAQAQAAAGSASAAAGSATAASESAAAAATSETNASGSASAAAGSATSAGTSASAATESASAAAGSAEDSEAWAVGQRGGQDVPSSDETYHNNAKYWAGQAHQAAGGGVTSFNGRSGAVTPESGDYTAAMVGADASGAAAAVQGNLDTHTGNSDIHVTAAQKTAWSGKQDALTFDSAPTSGSTNPVTSGGVYTAIQNAGKEPYVYSFAANDWTAGTNESTITIAAATHGITGSDILFNFWHQVSGAYVFNTWACIESWAEIDASTHVITLHGPATGYAGKVVLYG